MVSTSQNKEFSLPFLYKPVACKYEVLYLKRIKSVLIYYKCLALFSTYYLPIVAKLFTPSVRCQVCSDANDKELDSVNVVVKTGNSWQRLIFSRMTSIASVN